MCNLPSPGNCNAEIIKALQEAKQALETAQEELQEIRLKRDNDDECIAKANSELKNELMDCQKQIENLQGERDDFHSRLACQENRWHNLCNVLYS